MSEDEAQFDFQQSLMAKNCRFPTYIINSFKGYVWAILAFRT